MIKAIIWDLDNTIYPVRSIGRHCLSFYSNYIFHRMLFTRTIQPFPGYKEVNNFRENYLVTDGITSLQQSKIRQLHIEKDFKKIYILDPRHTKLTKKDIFTKIKEDKGYLSDELLVIGDDPDVEIKMAHELDIPTLLFDFKARYASYTKAPVITSLLELKHFLE